MFHIQDILKILEAKPFLLKKYFMILCNHAVIFIDLKVSQILGQ